MSAVPTQLGKAPRKKVSALPTQLKNRQFERFLSLLSQVAWANHLEIMSATKSDEEKLFYLLRNTKETWSMRELRRQIQTGSYERTMMSTQFTSNIQTKLPKQLFKDPYVFEFLQLPEKHSELDLEKAIMLNLQKFIL